MNSLFVSLVTLYFVSVAAVELNCMALEGKIDPEMILQSCKDASSLGGEGTLVLDKASQNTIMELFHNKEIVNMTIRLWDSPQNPKIVDLGTVRSIGNQQPKTLGLWIENSDVVFINATNLKVVYGLRVRGNKRLLKESIDKLKATEDDRQIKDEFVASAIKYRSIQDVGECNIDMSHNPPNTVGCVYVNNLIVQTGARIARDFAPKRIASCVYLAETVSKNDYLRNVDFSDPDNFNCNKYSMTVLGGMDVANAIVGNSPLCIKEFNSDLKISQITSMQNGNRECKFECEDQDITAFKQRWCEVVSGELLINDELAAAVNLTEVTEVLKTVSGSIRIENLRNWTENVLDFRALEWVKAGPLRADSSITVRNTTLKTILFKNLSSIRGGVKAFVVEDDNPFLEFANKTIDIIQEAANDRGITFKKKPVKQEEHKKKAEEPKEEEETTTVEERNDLGLIIGLSTGGAILLLVAVVGVIVTVVLVRRKKKSGNKKKKKEKKSAKTSKGSATYKAVSGQESSNDK